MLLQGPVSKLDIKRLTERAIKSAANYNAFLSRERREERRHYFDIHTGVSPPLLRVIGEICMLFSYCVI